MQKIVPDGPINRIKLARVKKLFDRIRIRRGCRILCCSRVFVCSSPRDSHRLSSSFASPFVAQSPGVASRAPSPSGLEQRSADEETPRAGLIITSDSCTSRSLSRHGDVLRLSRPAVDRRLHGVQLLSSVGIINLNKLVFAEYHFRFPTFLTGVHFVVTFMGLVACNAAGQ
jgi:hypothetical protein